MVTPALFVIVKKVAICQLMDIFGLKRLGRIKEMEVTTNGNMLSFWAEKMF
jgi:hypothetical protein